MSIFITQYPAAQAYTPIIAALFGAIVGGIITYLAEIRSENRLRKYDLKMDAYYEFLKIAANGLSVDFITMVSTAGSI